MSTLIYLIDVTRKEKCCLGSDSIMTEMKVFRKGTLREDVMLNDIALMHYIGSPMFRFNSGDFNILSKVIMRSSSSKCVQEKDTLIQFVNRLYKRYAGVPFVLVHEPHIEILPAPFDRYHDGKAMIGYLSPVNMCAFGIKKGHVFIKKITERLDAVYVPYGSYVQQSMNGETQPLYLPSEIVETWEPLYE